MELVKLFRSRVIIFCGFSKNVAWKLKLLGDGVLLAIILMECEVTTSLRCCYVE